MTLRITQGEDMSGRSLFAATRQGLKKRYQITERTLREWQMVLGLESPPREAPFTEMQVKLLDELYLARLLGLGGPLWYSRQITQGKGLEDSFREICSQIPFVEFLQQLPPQKREDPVVNDKILSLINNKKATQSQ